MSSNFRESIDIIHAHESARLAGELAAARVKRQIARDARDAAQAEMAAERERLDALEKAPKAKLGKDDASLQQYLDGIARAKLRVERGEALAAEAEAPAQEAEAQLAEAEQRIEQERASGWEEREALLDMAGERFDGPARALKKLLIEAAAIQAWAAAIKKGDSQRPKPAAAEAVTLRVELVDGAGRRILAADSGALLVGEG